MNEHGFAPGSREGARRPSHRKMARNYDEGNVRSGGEASRGQAGAAGHSPNPAEALAGPRGQRFGAFSRRANRINGLRADSCDSRRLAARQKPHFCHNYLTIICSINNDFSDLPPSHRAGPQISRPRRAASRPRFARPAPGRGRRSPGRSCAGRRAATARRRARAAATPLSIGGAEQRLVHAGDGGADAVRNSRMERRHQPEAAAASVAAIVGASQGRTARPARPLRIIASKQADACDRFAPQRGSARLFEPLSRRSRPCTGPIRHWGDRC